MRIALRCDRHKHGEYDTDDRIFIRKCRQCSKAEGQPVYHRWRISDGVLIGADTDEYDPQHQ